MDDLPTLDLDTPGVKERIAEDSKKLEKFRNEMKGQHEAKQREFEMILEEQRTAEMMLEDMLSHVLLNRGYRPGGFRVFILLIVASCLPLHYDANYYGTQMLLAFLVFVFSLAM